MQNRRTVLRTLGAVLATPPNLWAGVLPTAAPSQAPYADRVSVTVVLENETIRASRVVFEPGGGERPHAHDWDLVTVALTPADFEITRGTETVRVQRHPGDVALIPKGAVHAARNLGTARAEVVTIALKRPAPGGAR